MCLIGTTSLLMVVPWWVRGAIDVIERGDPDWELGGYVLRIALAAAGGGLLRGVARSIIFNAGRNVEYDLRNDLFAHLEKLPLGYYQAQKTGDLMSRAVNDINAVRMLLGPGFLNLVNTPLYLVYAAVFMFAMNWQLTLAVGACLTLLALVFKQFRGRIRRASLRVQRQMSRMSAHVQENLSGMHVVKAYVQAEPQTAGFTGMNDEYQVRSLDLARCRGLINPVMVALHGLTVLVVLWYGGWLIMREQSGVADLVAFILYLNVLAWPMAAFGWMLSLLERGRAAMDRLEEIFEVEPAIADPEHPVPLRGQGAGHRVRPRVVRGTMATRCSRTSASEVPPGRKVAIVGRTGSGKSTLTHLIPRLHDVTSGTIRMGGVDVRSLSLEDLRGAIGYAPQDPFLFSTSIQDNLKFGDAHASEQEVRRVLDVADLESEVEVFPDGLDTRVGGAGHHPVRRPEAAGNPGPGHPGQSRLPDPGRLPVQRGRAHRAAHTRQLRERAQGQDLHHHLAPDGRHQASRRDPGDGRRTHRRARRSRVAAARRRAVRADVPAPADVGRAGGAVGTCAPVEVSGTGRP